MHLVMFDIDGTLVDSAGFEGDFYAEAVESVLNVRVNRNWDVYEHVSDSGILEQVLREAVARRRSRRACRMRAAAFRRQRERLPRRQPGRAPRDRGCQAPRGTPARAARRASGRGDRRLARDGAPQAAPRRHRPRAPCVCEQLRRPSAYRDHAARGAARHAGDGFQRAPRISATGPGIGVPASS